MPDQKESTASALKSTRSFNFPAGDALQMPYIIFVQICVVRDAAFPKLWMSFNVRLEFQRLLI